MTSSAFSENCLGQLDLHPGVPDVLEQDTSEFRTPENRSTPFRVFAINGFSSAPKGAGDQEMSQNTGIRPDHSRPSSMAHELLAPRSRTARRNPFQDLTCFGQEPLRIGRSERIPISIHTMAS
jgi:hypothetical protein